jgi:hypothetical protein
MLSSSSGERSETGGPSGACEREPVAVWIFDIARRRHRFGAAGSPGLRCVDAACRRMTKAWGQPRSDPASTSVTPSARKLSRAAAAVSGAMARLASEITTASKPSRTASSAVKRTQ